MEDYSIPKLTEVKGGHVIGLVNEEVFKGEKPKETSPQPKTERKRKTTK